MPLASVYNTGAMALKIVIAPQSFKSSVSALEAAQAIARGVLAAEPAAETVLVPVADGGDGTLNALVEGTGGQTFRSVVTGPLGQSVEASWGVMRDGRTAVIEMARASGLALLPPRKRNPRATTTRGTGELIKEALERGYTRILVGLGGSATNDGGAGMAGALGFKLLDARGHPLPAGGAALAKLARIDPSGKHPKLAQATVVGVTDVTNPLCGPTGASAVYGPQKGASPEVVAELDAALRSFAQVVQRDLGQAVLDRPRAGAAGGLGAGLLAFTGAELRSGIDLVCEAVGFDAHLEGASLVITGEGRADHSSIYDKAPVGVARRAQARGVPTILLAGSLGQGYEELYQHGIAGIMCIADRPMSFEQSLARTEELLAGAAERALRLMRVGTAIRS
ncbi:MAG TPA: glycerate kinase [Dehalococcoidia bacterium]|nr:glycerate kinase [Dehalococcoidia bacterium]